MTRSPDYARKVVHTLVGGLAFLLPHVQWWQATMLACAALLFTLLVLPRVGGHRLCRPSDVSGGMPAGLVLYPVSVLLLILLFPRRPDIAASAWGILAFGDGMATIAGRAIGGPRIPWNRDKTWAGSAALFTCGSAAGVVLAWWCRGAIDPSPPLWFTIGGPIAAAFAAAAAETIPVRLDGNLSVPAAAAGVLWIASLLSGDVARTAMAEVYSRLPYAAVLNLVASWVGYRVQVVSMSGAICGAAIGIVIFMTTGWTGWLLLFATLGVAAGTSRLGLRRKRLLGIDQSREGRRGGASAFANTGVATLAALVVSLGPLTEPASIAFAAALAAGGSDTIASEIGKAWGRRAFLVHTLVPVPAGTPGAVSLEGSAAGLVGAFALASVALSLRLVPSAALLPIVAAATVGAFAESLMGATLEPPGILNNDLLNFLNTAIAALTAVGLMRLVG